MSKKGDLGHPASKFESVLIELIAESHGLVNFCWINSSFLFLHYETVERMGIQLYGVVKISSTSGMSHAEGEVEMKVSRLSGYNVNRISCLSSSSNSKSASSL